MSVHYVQPDTSVGHRGSAHLVAPVQKAITALMGNPPQHQSTIRVLQAAAVQWVPQDRCCALLEPSQLTAAQATVQLLKQANTQMKVHQLLSPALPGTTAVKAQALIGVLVLLEPIQICQD